MVALEAVLPLSLWLLSCGLGDSGLQKFPPALLRLTLARPPLLRVPSAAQTDAKVTNHGLEARRQSRLAPDLRAHPGRPLQPPPPDLHASPPPASALPPRLPATPTPGGTSAVSPAYQTARG